ncbi:MAG: hypothetical protein K8R21_01835 [Leptospira sp.]|nr:hypothetical protein [Leptospira sp.]
MKRKIFVILSITISYSLFSNHNIDPGKIHLLHERNSMYERATGKHDLNLVLVARRLASGDNKEVKSAVKEVRESLDPRGLELLRKAYFHINPIDARVEIVRAIGHYRSPEAELILTGMISSSAGDEVFYEFVEELKNMNSIVINGNVVQYRPYSENLVTLFKKMVTSSFLSNDQKGALILSIGDMKDLRFMPVMQKLREERSDFIRDLAKLVYETQYMNIDVAKR